MSTVSRVVPRSLIAAVLLAGMLFATGPHARADGPWPQGTFSKIDGTVYTCPDHFSCFKFRVASCPNVKADSDGGVAESDPAGTPRGVVIFFRGGGAADW